MITQRQYLKSESPVALGTAQFYSIGRRRSSSSSSSSALGAVTSGEMPMKLEERLNELESNAVRALLSLGEAFVSGQSSPYKNQIKKQPESNAYVKPLHSQVQNHQQQQQQPISIARSVIVKAEPGLGYYEEKINHNAKSQPPPAAPPPEPRKSFPNTPISISSSSSGHFTRELSCNSKNVGSGQFNQQQHQQTISLTPITKSSISSGPSQHHHQQSNSNGTNIAPVSIQPVVSGVSSSSATPVISTIFYQIPASVSAGSATNGNGGTATVMSPSFTIIPAPNGRTVIPLPMVTTNAPPLVKIEPGTGNGPQNGTPVNWSNIQVLKVPRSSVENGSNGMTFSAMVPATVATSCSEVVPGVAIKNSNVAAGAKLLPSPGKADGKSSVTPSGGTTTDGKSPTKSRARRRSQSTTKGQSRSSRVSSGSSELVVSSNVEGLPNIIVDGYEIPREIWAKSFLQTDAVHAAGTLFNALFSSEEIKNCTLNGRNGTRQLCPEKRQAIFKIVAWMKNKCQDPYSFNKSPEDTKILNREEQMMIEKKVFVERRYQTSRKIRDLPSTPPQASVSPPTSTVASNQSSSSSPVSSSTNISPPTSTTTSYSPNSGGMNLTTPVKKCATTTSSPPLPSSLLMTGGSEYKRRDSSGSFSSVCSSTGDDKGIPKIALIQSSEIIANYFQSAEPLPPVVNPSPPGSIIKINNHQHDGPPPMKMQKVG